MRPADIELPALHDRDRPEVIKPGWVSPDVIEQARYDALFASMGPVQGISPSIDSGGPARVWIEERKP